MGILVGIRTVKLTDKTKGNFEFWFRGPQVLREDRVGWAKYQKNMGK